MAIELLRRRPPSELLPTRAAEGLCKGFEGLSLKSYPDPASERAKTGKGKGDPWTIGWGHTGPEVVEGLVWTLAACEEAFIADLAEAAQIVRDNITVPLTQGEFDALTSLAFNIGYIPRSMKACLNGGTTDKGKVMAPGSYGSAMYEFPRNCRAGGVPMRGVYRRRLAEACVFSDLPWENACSVSVIRLKVDANNNIDPVESTSLEDTLMRARQDIPDTRPSPTPVFEKNWPDLTPPPKPEASVTIIEDKPELVLTTPATPESVPAVNAGQPEPQPSQAPAAPAAPSQQPKPTVSGPAKVEAKPDVIGPSSPPAPQPRPAPVPTKPPPEPVIIAPKSVDVRSIPYGEIDPEKGAKNMTDSQRAMGMVIVGIGSVIQVVTTRLGVGTAVGAIAFDLSRDPVVIALIATAVAVGIGWLTRKRGTKVMKDGMVNATQVLK